MRGAWIVVARWCLVMAFLGCGGSDYAAAESVNATDVCVPNAQTSCACPGGAQGVRVCDPSGSALGPCQCSAGQPQDAGSDALTLLDGATDTTPPRCDPKKPFGSPVEIAELNMGGGVEDGGFRISADELTGYLHSARAGGAGSLSQIYQTTRASRTAPWGTPVAVQGLGAVTRFPGRTTPTTTADGLQLFVSQPSDNGDLELAVSTRASATGAFGAVALVAGINTGANELQPFVSADGLNLYFYSNRSPGLGIFVASRTTATGAFGTPTPVPGLPLGGVDAPLCLHPVLTPDELTIFFARPTTAPNNAVDIYVATRASKTAAFGAATVVTEVNSMQNDRPSAITADGCVLYFASDRKGLSGQGDIYVAQRPL